MGFSHLPLFLSNISHFIKLPWEAVINPNSIHYLCVCGAALLPGQTGSIWTHVPPADEAVRPERLPRVPLHEWIHVTVFNSFPPYVTNCVQLLLKYTCLLDQIKVALMYLWTLPAGVYERMKVVMNRSRTEQHLMMTVNHNPVTSELVEHGPEFSDVRGKGDVRVQDDDSVQV